MGLGTGLAMLLTIGTARAETVEEHRRLSAEQSQYFLDVAQLTSSCADIAKLEQTATTKLPMIAKMYVTEASRRREAQLAAMRRDISAFAEQTKGWTAESLAESDSPDGADSAGFGPRQAIAKLRAELTADRCYDETTIDEALKRLDAVDAEYAKMIAAETSCRETPACMGPRIAADTCAWIAQRREIMAAIATEKSNPAGVVDLVKLHDLGVNAQTASQAIAADKARYVKLTGNAFSEASCNRQRSGAANGN